MSAVQSYLNREFSQFRGSSGIGKVEFNVLLTPKGKEKYSAGLNGGSVGTLGSSQKSLEKGFRF